MHELVRRVQDGVGYGAESPHFGGPVQAVERPHQLVGVVPVCAVDGESEHAAV